MKDKGNWPKPEDMLDHACKMIRKDSDWQVGVREAIKELEKSSSDKEHTTRDLTSLYLDTYPVFPNDDE